MIISRDSLHIVFVESFYDVPIAGTCLVDGRLHKFNLIDWDSEICEYEVISLSFREMIKERHRQRMFEICVGTHQTYNGNKRRHRSRRRWPWWFWKILYNWYWDVYKNNMPE